MIDDFNEYSNRNNLNITVTLNTYRITGDFDSFGLTLESLFLKRSNKYDIYYYDSVYTQKYGAYLLDLKKYLPKEHIEMYDSKLLSESCTYGEKLIGL
eukprot:jgi/Orpsp1_1/1177076/evm.model.c7180000060115.1